MCGGACARPVGHRERDGVKRLPGVAGGVDSLHRRLLRSRVGLVERTRWATFELATEPFCEPTSEVGAREDEEAGKAVPPSFAYDELDADGPAFRFDHAAALNVDSA